jgi:hypothetical protein
LERYEVTGGKNNEQFYLRSRPKLVKLAALGDGPTRGGFKASNGRSFAVSGNALYEITDPSNPALLGTGNTSSGPVCFADNGTQLVIVDGTNGYLLDFTANTLGLISSAGFPSNPTMCAFLDQYILVVNGLTGSFEFSAIADASSWDALDFATAEGSPDLTNALIVDHRQVIIGGEQTIELWFNDGTSPFSRIANGFIEHGIAAPHTMCKIDNTIFWVGKDANGQGIVWRLGDGSAIQRISTFALEYAIGQYGDISTATGFALQYGGHSLYALNFPNANTTWVYDAATQAWSEWDYTKPTGGIGRFRGEWHCFAGSKHITGDYENGNIYEMQDPYLNSSTEYTDDGAPITRERTAPHITNEAKRFSIPSATVDLETGIGRATGADDAVEPQLMLQYSKDGGHTWSSWKQASLGKQGEYKTRVIFSRLGQARSFTPRVRITSPVPVTLISAFGDVTSGTS